MRRVFMIGVVGVLICGVSTSSMHGAIMAATEGAARKESVRAPDAEPARRPYYAVLFGVTVDQRREITRVRVVKVVDATSRSTAAINYDVTPEYIRHATALIEKHGYEPRLENGVPVELFTYFYVDPNAPNEVIDHVPTP